MNIITRSSNIVLFEWHWVRIVSYPRSATSCGSILFLSEDNWGQVETPSAWRKTHQVLPAVSLWAICRWESKRSLLRALDHCRFSSCIFSSLIHYTSYFHTHCSTMFLFRYEYFVRACQCRTCIQQSLHTHPSRYHLPLQFDVQVFSIGMTTYRNTQYSSG